MYMFLTQLELPWTYFYLLLSILECKYFIFFKNVKYFCVHFSFLSLCLSLVVTKRQYAIYVCKSTYAHR